jgi:hypothetical protein
MSPRRFTPPIYRPPKAQPSHRAGRPEDARLAMEDDRADDPVAKVWRSSSIGPMELQRLLPVLAARRQTVDEDLRRLIAAAESIGMLDIVVRARTTLAGRSTGKEKRKENGRYAPVAHRCISRLLSAETPGACAMQQLFEMVLLYWLTSDICSRSQFSLFPVVAGGSSSVQYRTHNAGLIPSDVGRSRGLPPRKGALMGSPA